MKILPIFSLAKANQLSARTTLLIAKRSCAHQAEDRNVLRSGFKDVALSRETYFNFLSAKWKENSEREALVSYIFKQKVSKM